MKTRILTILLSVFTVFTFAQITVTDNDILSIGDVVYQPEDDNTGPQITPGNSGANQIWDFSSLVVADIVTTECISPVGTPYESSYPNANICLKAEGDYMYFNKSSTKVELLGEGDSTFQQPIVMLPLPLTYGMIFTDGPISVLDSLISGPMVSLLLSTQGLSAAMISLGAAQTADTINIQAEMTSDFNVDAYGSMTLPMGTFDCLRLKIERTSSTSIQVYCTDTITGAGSGWYPIPFSDLSQEITYQWWSDNMSTKFALVDMPIDSLGNVDGGVIFLHDVASSLNQLDSKSFNIFPIPTTYKVTITSENNEKINATLSDLNGREVKRFEFSNSTTLNLSDLDKGIYLLNLKTEKGSVTKKIIID